MMTERQLRNKGESDQLFSFTYTLLPLVSVIPSSVRLPYPALAPCSCFPGSSSFHLKTLEYETTSPWCHFLSLTSGAATSCILLAPWSCLCQGHGACSSPLFEGNASSSGLQTPVPSHLISLLLVHESRIPFFILIHLQQAGQKVQSLTTSTSTVVPKPCRPLVRMRWCLISCIQGPINITMGFLVTAPGLYCTVPAPGSA